MAEINERFYEPDNCEVLRDQISAIIALEMENQFELAKTDEDPVADDYNCAVFVENDEPWQAGEERDLFPLVNISLESVKRDKEASVNDRSNVATFNIDCYQEGNRTGKFAGRTAVIKAWKLARCIRRILKSDHYTYLKLRGIVSKKSILSMQGGYPAGMENSAVKVAVVRVVLEVTYDEEAPRTSGPGFEIMPVVISDDNGQVVINIE